MCPKISLNEESFSDGDQTRLNKKGDLLTLLVGKFRIVWLQEQLDSRATSFTSPVKCGCH